MVFDTLSSLFGSVPADVVVDSIASGLPSKLLADAGVFATANGFAAMALNRGKVKNFVLGTRKIYKGWAHGYLGAVRTVRGDMVRTVAAGVKSTLGPSAVYACSMQVATSAMGLPSLVSVGAANVATPVVVAKLGGRLRNLSAQSLTARAMPIAAHFLIEFGLYDKIKHWMDSRNASASHPWVPNAHGRVTNAVRGAVSGGVCAFGATALTAVALSPYYGRRLISRAVTCSDVPTAARLGTAALRVTRIRLADSLQQGVVWFATYEAMRAATAKMEDETEWKKREEDAVVPARITRHARGVFTTARLHTAYGVHLRTSRERRGLAMKVIRPAPPVRQRLASAAC